jgi:cytochrome oxidase Cu insertion factor (SCO1/SenC/PrrC family)
LVAVLLLAAAALPGAAAPDFGAMRVQPYEPPKPAPAFSLPDLGGKTWSLAEAKGKVVLLFFWATW